MASSALPPAPASVHFMGIGGIGVSGLARILLEQGYRVSGCDVTPNRLTEQLRERGAQIFTGHDPAHLDGVDLLVISAAVRAGNPEYDAAHARHLPTVKRAELLGRLLDGRRLIAVAGTHGKTTTSALTASILVGAGIDPTAFVGGEVQALGGNARGGQGLWAVAEADEYDRSFLRLAPHVAVVTNVEVDHLDIYRDLTAVKEAFAAFIALLPPDGTLIACADDAVALDLARDASCRVVTYGVNPVASWRATDVELDAHGSRFTVRGPDGVHLTVRTPLSGLYNVVNALAAVAACACAGVDPRTAGDILRDTAAPRRRQEVKGRARGGALIVDDYAHHPTEVRATLAGLRARYPGRRLRVAFQPHTYTRTHALLSEIGDSFGDADDVAVAEIYAAREKDTLGVGGRDVADAVRQHGIPAAFTATLDDAARWLASDDAADVVLVTMGAGDIWKAGEQICAGS